MHITDVSFNSKLEQLLKNKPNFSHPIHQTVQITKVLYLKSEKNTQQLTILWLISAKEFRWR